MRFRKGLVKHIRQIFRGSNFRPLAGLMLVKEFPRRSMRSLIAVQRDLLRQPALALERPPENALAAATSAWRGAEIHRSSLLVDSAVNIGPPAFDLHIGFVDAPGCAGPAGKAVPTLLNSGT